MVEAALHLLLGSGWISIIVITTLAILGLLLKHIVEQKLGKASFRFLAASIGLFLVGGLFLSAPVEHIFCCSRSKTLCQSLTKDLMGRTNIAQHFKISDVLSVNMNNRRHITNPEKPHYWLEVRTIDAKVYEVGGAYRTLKPYNNLKNFIENKNRQDHSISKETKTAFNLGIVSLIAGFICAVIGLYKSTLPLTSRLATPILGLLMSLGGITLVLGCLSTIVWFVYYLADTIIKNPISALKIFGLSIASVLIPAIAIILCIALYFALQVLWAHPNNAFPKLFRNWSFYPQEVEAALEILDEASKDFDNAFFLKDIIRKNILKNRKQFTINIHKDGRSVRKHVYSMISNVAANLVESGEYHIYRGVLNPHRAGYTLLRIFDSTIDELVKLGDVDDAWAKEQKAIVRSNLAELG